MDDNVQNIRSGRALAGFGKFFSGLGLVIAAIGAILGGAVPVIVVGVVLLIIGGLMGSAGGKKLQGAAQGGLAQAAMEQELEEAEYRPGSCIDGGKFAESGLGLPSADNVGGSGLVCGKYHGRPLEISNLELSNTQAYQNPETEVWEDRELPIFKGQWMAADLGRSISCNVQVAPKGKLARLLGRDSFNSENPEFDRRFSIQYDNPAAVQSVLSPRVMDQLLKMGSVYLSVKADGRVFAAIQTVDLLFGAGKGRADSLTQRFVGQLRVFTDLLDALKG